MFHLKENNTTVKTEILAGMTTFLTMAYIVIVNPIILADAGVPFDQVFLATIIAAVIGTLWMALFANYPIAIAPGMGLNAYFTSVVLASNGQLDYMTAFSAVFVAGILFVLLSLTSFREKLIESIPENLKHGITAGIGLFIAFIGLRLSGLVTSHETNLVQLGELTSPPVLLALFGLLVTIIFMTMNIYGSIFIGMALTGIVAVFTGQLKFHGSPYENPFITGRDSCLESSSGIRGCHFTRLIRRRLRIPYRYVVRYDGYNDWRR